MLADRTTKNDYTSAKTLQPLYTVLTVTHWKPIAAWSGTPGLKVQSFETGKEKAFIAVQLGK